MSKGKIRFGAVLAGAIVIAVAVWFLMSARKDHKPSIGTPSATLKAGAPLSKRTLITMSRTTHRPVYWVGPQAKTGYEFDVLKNGRTYVRYLPKGVKVGDARPNFLVVGTYELPHPFADLQKAGHSNGAETVNLPNGGIALMDRSDPTSAFIARPNWKAQVEIYSPKPGQAMTLILQGAVRPLR